MSGHPHIDFAGRYLQAVADGTDLASFFHPDAVQHELTNALLPDGVVRDLAAILEAAERGRAALSHQRFEVINAVAAGDHVALEVGWTGTLARSVGEWPAGHVLRARIATFLELRDGRIAVQRNYDCYENPADSRRVGDFDRGGRPTADAELAAGPDQVEQDQMHRG